MSTATLPSFADFASSGGLFLWVNTSGRPCPGPAGGCEARNDVKRTLEEWVALGLPRTGWSYCKHRCHCVLLPLIPFGLQIADELDQPGASIKPSESLSPPARFDATKPFAEQGPLGADGLIAALRELPLVGGMRDEVESIIRALEDGTLSYPQALALLDDLFGRAGGGRRSTPQGQREPRPPAPGPEDEPDERPRTPVRPRPTGASDDDLDQRLANILSGRSATGGRVEPDREWSFSGLTWGQVRDRLPDGVLDVVPIRSDMSSMDEGQPMNLLLLFEDGRPEQILETRVPLKVANRVRTAVRSSRRR